MNANEGNDLIRRRILTSGPFMAARMGKVELDCVARSKDFPESIINQAHTNAGIFSNGGKPDADMLERFKTAYLGSIKQADVMATWLGDAEKRIVDSLAPHAERVPLRSLEPYYHDNPWTGALEGLDILVIHPFANSIKAQYDKRKLLFQDERVLPEFNLKTIKAVQSNAGNVVPYEDWEDALYSMIDEMEVIKFDVAIIGAGAYGLPLAKAAKDLGRKAVQMAGATQILFGIKGGRWDEHDVIGRMYNENWIRPSAAETPFLAGSVENGCYW